MSLAYLLITSWHIERQCCRVSAYPFLAHAVPSDFLSDFGAGPLDVCVFVPAQRRSFDYLWVLRLVLRFLLLLITKGPISDSGGRLASLLSVFAVV